MALDILLEKVRAPALTFSWENCARQFLDNIAYASESVVLGDNVLHMTARDLNSARRRGV